MENLVSHSYDALAEFHLYGWEYTASTDILVDHKKQFYAQEIGITEGYNYQGISQILLRLDKLEEFAKISEISESKLNYQATKGVVKTSISELQSFGERMTRKELAVFLGTPLNTINQWVKEGRINPTLGYKFEKSVVLEQLREYTQRKRDAKKSKPAPIVKSKPAPAAKIDQNFKIEFQVPLGNFIKVLWVNNYLTEDDKKRFARFQSCSLVNDYPKIISGTQYVKSFVTFVLVATELGWIKNTSTKVPDRINGGFLIPMKYFFDNFERGSGWDDASVSNSKKEVVKVIDAIKDNTIKYIKTEYPSVVAKDLSFNKILNYFFAGKDSLDLGNIYIDIDEGINGIDWKMLRIMWEHHNENYLPYCKN